MFNIETLNIIFCNIQHGLFYVSQFLIVINEEFISIHYILREQDCICNYAVRLDELFLFHKICAGADNIGRFIFITNKLCANTRTVDNFIYL